MDQNAGSHPMLKTKDVYKVDEKLPARFNNPDCFHGYIKKKTHPLYVTSNQTYGSKKPTIHEMPTEFNGSFRKFSDAMLRSGMYRDNGFNTCSDKSLITGFGAIAMHHDRINFHHIYNHNDTAKNCAPYHQGTNK
ncbi:piercer of microtubule wall 2 protein [Aplochiton taeniatus]